MLKRQNRKLRRMQARKGGSIITASSTKKKIRRKEKEKENVLNRSTTEKVSVSVGDHSLSLY